MLGTGLRHAIPHGRPRDRVCRNYGKRISILSVTMNVVYNIWQTQQAMDVSVMKGKLDTDTFTFLLRHEEPKYSRVKDLLHANEILRSACSSGFDPADEKQYS